MEPYGLDNQTGGSLSGLQHLRQSITDILTTPVGSRVMRRDYGSRIFESLDAPLTRSTQVDIYAAAADALNTWEPRLQLTGMEVQRVDSAGITLSVSGYLLESGEPITLEGIAL